MSERVLASPSPAAVFTRHAEAVDAEVRELHGEEQLRTALDELTRTPGGGQLRVTGASSAASLGYTAAGSLELVLQSDVAVSVAAAGVVETGSVVITPGSRAERLAQVLPPTQVVVLPSDRMVATLGEAMELTNRWATTGQPYVSFITGPSRTADIERVITVGAHGPRRLVVLIVHAWHPAADA